MSNVKILKHQDLGKLEREINAALDDPKHPREFHSITLGMELYVAVLVPKAPAIEAVLELESDKPHVPRKRASAKKPATKSRE